MRTTWLVMVLLAAAGAGAAYAQDAASNQAENVLPIKEVTVFKDGHAFVLHEGSLPVDESGVAVLDRLPTPVLGTFWSYVTEPRAKLAAVVAGTRTVQEDTERKVDNMRTLLEANVGSTAHITDHNGRRFHAEILEVGEIVLLKEGDQVHAFEIGRISDVTFAGAPKTAIPRKEEKKRTQLTLRLDWADGVPGTEVQAGLMYLQKGLRWIPSYKVDLDGEGQAMVRLEATVINELADLENAAVHLVIGVPSFAFADKVDPMALRQTLGDLGEFFQRNDLDNQFSNAILTRQQVRVIAPQDAPPLDLGPDFGADERGEDLYIFTLDGVTLKKGERMVVPVAEYAFAYEDVFRVEIPPAPPQELRRHLRGEWEARIAQLSAAPKVVHSVRLDNSSDQPMTTAPALILRKGSLLAQSLMTYTPTKGKVDLEITKAVNVHIRKEDSETGRIPEAVQWRSQAYQRVNMTGTISLINYLPKPITVEVVRYILGRGDEADSDGVIKQVNVFESARLGRTWDFVAPLPDWWKHFNGIGQFTWSVPLEPGAAADIHYAWHYLSD